MTWCRDPRRGLALDLLDLVAGGVRVRHLGRPLHRFTAALLGGRDVDAAAADFRRLADRVITAETGQPAR